MAGVSMETKGLDFLKDADSFSTDSDIARSVIIQVFITSSNKGFHCQFLSFLHAGDITQNWAFLKFGKRLIIPLLCIRRLIKNLKIKGECKQY